MASPMNPPVHAPEFLASCGWKGAEILPLAGDASFRRYFRVVEGDRSAVLMDAPPPHEDPRPFVAVAEWLSSVGLTAPPILARDLDKGLLLLGDFGDWRLREYLDEDPRREQRALRARDRRPRPPPPHAPMPGLPEHGLDAWLDELDLFIDWYCPAVGIELDREGYSSAWREVLEPVASDGLGPVTVLRDYHAENVMLVDGRRRRCAFRPARFPGRARRASRLRSRLGAGGCAPRCSARDRARDDRPLRRRDRQW